MIIRLLHFCLRERLVVLLAAGALAAYGWYATKTVPLDAIPDIGENQVIVLSEWPGQSPKDMEDQITYPLSVALQAVPGAKNAQKHFNNNTTQHLLLCLKHGIYLSRFHHASHTIYTI